LAEILIIFLKNMIRKILQLMLPAKIFQNIKDESKKWFMVCDECGYTISYWEAGGIRVYGTKNKKTFGRCPNCKKWKFFSVIKKA
jgi:uncharacterized protein with PIN domain